MKIQTLLAAALLLVSILSLAGCLGVCHLM